MVKYALKVSNVTTIDKVSGCIYTIMDDDRAKPYWGYVNTITKDSLNIDNDETLATYFYSKAMCIKVKSECVKILDNSLIFDRLPYNYELEMCEI